MNSRWVRIDSLIARKPGSAGATDARMGLFLEALLRMVRAGPTWQDLAARFDDWGISIIDIMVRAFRRLDGASEKRGGGMSDDCVASRAP